MNANAAVVVPPTPIQGNQQNGNAVAPPPVDTNGLLTILMEQQRRNDEERRRYEEDMKEDRRRNDEERRRNDEERLRNDDKFQTQSNQISEQNNNIANLVKEMADVKPRLNTLETGFAKMETRQDALDTRQNTLETEHRNDISALEARLRTVEKRARDRVQNSHSSSDFDFSEGKSTITSSHCEIILESYLTLSSSSSSSFLFVTVNNDDDESVSESLGRQFLSVNLKSDESPQQEILSTPERATAAGARRASDDQSEENVSDFDDEKSNDCWKLDDEDGVDVAEDESQMESDDESTLTECDDCRDQQAQTICFDKNCRRNFNRLTGRTLF